MQVHLDTKCILVRQEHFISVIAHAICKMKYKNGDCRRTMLYPCLLEVRHPWGEWEEPLALGC